MTPDVAERLKALETGEPLVFDGIDVVRCKVDGQQMLFCLDREHDPIQRNNRAGKFYEAPELRWIGQHVKPGATYFDIGANIGNHSLYFAKFLKAAKVIPIEPNPVAYKLLMANVILNGLTETIDLTRLGVGMSDEESQGFGVEDRDRNIGGTRMLPGEGDIEVYRGDNLFAREAPDLIKIDVEGMEMAALAGLETTITNHRPILLVEVDDINDAAFQEWFTERKFEPVKVWQRYKTNKNYLLRHIDAP